MRQQRQISLGKVPQRQLAVIETVDKQTKQLILASDVEFQIYKQEYPNLVVRWADAEDGKEWKLSDALFDDPEGIPGVRKLDAFDVTGRNKADVRREKEGRYVR